VKKTRGKATAKKTTRRKPTAKKARASGARKQEAILLVGTMKGAFVLRSDAARKNWRIEGPHFRGEAVYALLHDTRAGRPRTFAATNSMHWGPTLRTSDDSGRTWSEPGPQTVRFPAESGRALAQIWQIAPGRAKEPDVFYCGVEPAALFESRDGGKSWRARNAGVRAQFMPEEHRYPEFGQCVHKVVHHPSRPGRLFLQNHWGLYRSDDWGDSWKDIANGVPSDFGFAMQMHPHDPDTVYIVPIEADIFRATPEAKLRVYRTRNAGASWEPLTKGLPQKGAYENVLRDALTADSLDSAGIYFGTRSGKLYGSRDEGRTWTEIANALPPIVCVKTGTAGAA